MSEWKKYKLGEVLEIKNGKSRPKSFGTIPVYGGNGILGYSNEYNIDKQTLIIGRVGAYCGAVYFENNPIWVSDNALYAKPKKDANIKYLYYFLKYENLNKYAGGSSHPLLTQGRLNELDIKLPDLTTQAAIAEILSSLDDKIELNNKINQELEVLAQTLFKQWFIDFEFPNENGEPYKLSCGEMVDSELGEIPKGWEVGELNKIASLDRGNVKPFENPTKQYNHFSLPDFDNGKKPSLTFGSEILSSKYKITPYTVLVSKLNPRIPRVWLITDCNDDSICSTEFQIVKPKSKDYFTFICSLCSSNIFFDSLTSKVTGTSSSHQRVNPNDIINYKLPIPSEEIILKFNKVTIDLFISNNKNILENSYLMVTRDALLPKLISGELEINENNN